MKRILNSQTPQYVGKKVKVAGWVNTIRSHGKILFVDLRDKSGLLQIVFSQDKGDLYQKAIKLKPEWVIFVEGEIIKRPQQMVNPKIETGEIELHATEIDIYSESKTLPFPIDTPGYEINEETRLRYRYLDLRRERLQRNLRMRQKVIHFMREFLIEKGFIEIETPILTKSTPEGSRDFLVPSRLHQGKFYALPQSPQQYKQLLQVAGFEKYFQVARCFRDEDTRGDRQPEFTQLDIEMSFTDREEILCLIESLYIDLVKSLTPQKKITKIPFPRLTYKEVIQNYGSDKPDLRKNKKDPDELAFLFIIDFPMFEKKEDGTWGAAHHPFTLPKDEKGNPLTSTSIAWMKKNPEKVLAEQYDFVLNGCEIGGGSIRTTDLDILVAVFEVLGHKPSEIKKQFSNYFEAFSFGVPPHGGIAPGIDRFLAILLQEPNIREVIAFPKTGDNRELMMQSPSFVTKEQLKELHLKIQTSEKRTK